MKKTKQPTPPKVQRYPELWMRDNVIGKTPMIYLFRGKENTSFIGHRIWMTSLASRPLVKNRKYWTFIGEIKGEDMREYL